MHGKLAPGSTTAGHATSDLLKGWPAADDTATGHQCIAWDREFVWGKDRAGPDVRRRGADQVRRGAARAGGTARAGRGSGTDGCSMGLLADVFKMAVYPAHGGFPLAVARPFYSAAHA